MTRPKVPPLCVLEQTEMSFISEEKACEQPHQTAIVMVDMYWYRFTFQSDFSSNFLAILDTTINFLYAKSAFLHILREAQFSETLYGRAMHSLGRLYISPTFNIFAEKCHPKIWILSIVCDKDANFRRGAAYVGEIELGDSFPLYDGLNVAEFLTDFLSRLTQVSYKQAHKIDKTEKFKDFSSERT